MQLIENQAFQQDAKLKKWNAFTLKRFTLLLINSVSSLYINNFNASALS